MTDYPFVLCRHGYRCQGLSKATFNPELTERDRIFDRNYFEKACREYQLPTHPDILHRFTLQIDDIGIDPAALVHFLEGDLAYLIRTELDSWSPS